MITFENHPVRLEHINTRMERHGDDDEVLTMDLKLTADLPNTSLDEMSPTLRRSLYDPDEDGDILDPDNTPNLRNPQLGTLRWSIKVERVWFSFVDPDEQEALVAFSEAKFGRQVFTPKEGSTVTHTWRLQVHPQDKDVGARILSYLHRPDLRGMLLKADYPDEDGEDDE